MASDNKASPAPNTSFGFKISKPTFNAFKTSGQNYIFNSSWPSLQIAFQTTITSLSSLTFDTTYYAYRVPHNLGYPPFTFMWAVNKRYSTLANTYERYIPAVDNTYIYLQIPSSETLFAPVNIKCFNINLTKDVDYTLLTGDNSFLAYDSNFGIKISKSNKQTTSKDLRDYVVHSRAQSPLMLAVKTQKTITNPVSTVDGSYTIQYTSKLSYPAWVYGFVGRSTANNYYQFGQLYSQAYPRTFTDGFVSYISYLPSSGDDSATLVITRDPMFAPTITSVTY